MDNSGSREGFAQSAAHPLPNCPVPPALTPENLYELAGDGLRMMLDVSREQSRPLRERDIIEAAWRLFQCSISILQSGLRVRIPLGTTDWHSAFFESMLGEIIPNTLFATRAA